MRLSKKKFLFLACITLAVIICSTVVFSEMTVDINMRFSPDYGLTDISYLFDGRTLSSEDYKLIFYQTGLGKRAVDQLIAEKKTQKIIEYQQDFMSEKPTKCVREVITTCMEYTVDDVGIATAGFMLAPYNNGYVFAMTSSHTLGWRHGHVGIVTGVNQVLEAPMIGTVSGNFTANEWRSYPTFIMLRLKDVNDTELSEIARNADLQLKNIKYNIFAGIFKKAHGEIPPTTHCAHLVWYAFYNAGYDIDRNGGNIVSVSDIIHSDKFEVIQIYGLNPDIYWQRAVCD